MASNDNNNDGDGGNDGDGDSDGDDVGEDGNCGNIIDDDDINCDYINSKNFM